MKRFLITTIYITLSLAATANISPEEINDDGRETIFIYESLGNEIADIEMKMFANKDFKLVINLKKGRKYKLKGSWAKRGDFYFLTFTKSQMAVDQLFNMNDPQQVIVLNSEGIKINNSLSILWIWGIQCEKNVNVKVI